MEKTRISASDLVEEGFLTVLEAASFLGVSRAFVYVEMDRGEIVFSKFGRSRRIPVAALKHYAAERIIGPIEIKNAEVNDGRR